MAQHRMIYGNGQAEFFSSYAEARAFMIAQARFDRIAGASSAYYRIQRKVDDMWVKPARGRADRVADLPDAP